MAIFYSRKRRYALIIDPGGDILMSDGKGNQKWKRIEEITAKFNEHEFDSHKFFVNNKVSLMNRDWDEDKIIERLQTAQGFSLDYYEVKPPTAEEKEQAAEVLMSQAKQLFKEAEKLRPHTGQKIEEMVIEAPAVDEGYTKERRKREFSCKKCGFVAKSGAGLQNHIRLVHLEPIGVTKEGATNAVL